MSLRTLIGTQPETVGDLLLASEHRSLEGLELLTANRLDSGVFLLGYAAEMLLKTAAFIFVGAKPTDTTDGLRGAAKAYYKNKGLKPPAIPDDEHGHGLLYWRDYLERRRNELKKPLPAPTDKLLKPCIDRIHENWIVKMRYFQPQLKLGDALQVYEDVLWLEKNHQALYKV